ncbi:MAG TPA: ferric reductase-like transmembrane domain-containing protein [Trebonia sp.]|jgi:sulfoxide reductase heme-binding subunit YedZ
MAAGSTVGRRTGEYPFAGSYQPTPPQQKPAPDSRPPQRTKARLDEWMEVEFKFGGSKIKRRVVALVLLGIPGLVPLFLMLPALLTLNSNTFAVSVDDTLGTGAEVSLFLCLLVTPASTLTGQRWFVPLRRWYGIMMAVTAIGDATAAAITDDFAGGVFGRLAGHVFELMGFMMVMLVIPLLITSNAWSQKQLGKYWKRLQRLTYAIWGLLFLHLVLLEGFGFQRGDNGSGSPGDGDPIFHQRMYQYGACSLFLLVLRLPPVKRWIAAQQKEGRNGLVYATVTPMFALFLFGFIFIINELLFKGIDSFMETPSSE